jgi:hypothetical protein
VIGAVTGSVAAATQVYVARRDRADVRVGFGYTDEVGKLAAPYLDVTNAGRQPVAILDAGIYGGEMPIAVTKAQSGVGSWALHAIESPIVLQQGEHRRFPLGFRGVLGAVVNDGFHMDFPFRPYVDTPHGKTWGKAGPFVRMVYPEDARPPEIRQVLWDACDPPLSPARVEPKWKIWKKRELRTGASLRPSHDELRERTGPPLDPAGSND